MNWEDGRLFLAVARAGQMLRAAKTLGVSQAKLSRRMHALEKSLGTKLLIRTTTGCDLTEDGQQLLARLERAETEFMAAEDAFQVEGRGLSGTVRLGVPDGFGVLFLAPRMGRLAQKYPSLGIQLVPVPREFSLSQREADIAVIIGRPRQGRLVARKLTDYTLSLYASKAYLASAPPVNELDDLANHLLIGYVEDLIYSPALNFTREFYSGWTSRVEISSAIGQIEAVRAGVGIGILHDYLVQSDPDLVRLLPEHSIRRAYWLVYHENLRNISRVQAGVDFICECVKERRADFVADAE